VVVLAWDAALRGMTDWSDGHNVVLHEFAHQLDSESGRANGALSGQPGQLPRMAEVLTRD
jgi:Mlc titration factor MtfA (ptsG expression regulator)